MRQSWSAADKAEVVELAANGMPRRLIASKTGRSLASIEKVLWRANWTPERAEHNRKLQMEYDRRKREREASYAPVFRDYASAGRVPPETVAARIADRDRRMRAPPRDPSCLQLGDPPVGYSALDRRA